MVELGYQQGDQTPWAKTMRTCQLLLKLADGLWTFLEIEGVEPTNNSAERARRQSVIQRKIGCSATTWRRWHPNSAGSSALPANYGVRRLMRSATRFSRDLGVQSRQGGICRSLLQRVRTALRLQGRDIAVPGAGLGCPSLRRSNALTADRSLNCSTHATNSLPPQH